MIGKKMGHASAIVTVIIMISVSLIPLASAGYGRAEMAFLSADIQIENSYATTQITARFDNPLDVAIDENIHFDIPEDAFITNFSLAVDGVIYYAKIMKKAEAAESYEIAKDEGVSAGLLYTDGDSLSYDVNIAAKGSVTATLSYEDFIERTVSGYRYELDLRSYGKRTIGKMDVNVNMGYDRAIKDLEALTYEDRAVIDMEDSDHVGIVSFNETSFKAGSDLILHWDLEGLPVNGRMLFQEGAMADEDGYFMHVFNPGASELGGYIPKDIVFVLDKSGSMAGDKMEQLKDAFSQIVLELRPDDSFEIIRFHSYVEPEYGDLIVASDENLKSASEDIEGMYPDGSTDINSALIAALDMLDTPKDRVPLIVFLTDGVPTSGETRRDVIRENIQAHNEIGASIYSLGFGDDVEFDFLNALALENDGFALRIEEGEDAALQMTDFYDTISLPLLRDVDFAYDDGAYDVYPTHVDNLYEGSEIVVSGKYPRELRELSYEASGMTSDGKRHFSKTFTVDTSEDHLFIKRYWAYSMIRSYTDQIAVAGETEELVANITNISLEYGFVTDYTSMFVEVPQGEQKDPVIANPEVPLASTGPGGALDPGADFGRDAGSRPIDVIQPALPKDSKAHKSMNEVPGFDMILVIPVFVVVIVILGRKR